MLLICTAARETLKASLLEHAGGFGPSWLLLGEQNEGNDTCKTFRVNSVTAQVSLYFNSLAGCAEAAQMPGSSSSSEQSFEVRGVIASYSRAGRVQPPALCERQYKIASRLEI